MADSLVPVGPSRSGVAGPSALALPRVRRGAVAWFAVWLAVVPSALARAGTLAESDTFWQIRTGQLILDTGRIPTADPFSWTAAGRSWRPNSWGFDVLLAPVYQIGGLTAVALFGAALAMAIVALMMVMARRLGAGPVATAVVMLLAVPLVIGWFSVRPQLVDYLAVPALLLLLEAIAAGVSTRRVVAAIIGIGVLSAAWVNLHAAATLGVGLLGAAGAAWAVAAWRAGGPVRRIVAVASAAVASATLGTLANPGGWTVVVQGWEVHNASAGLIVEWLPLDVTDPVQDVTIVAGLLAGWVSVRRRWWRFAAVLAVLCAGAVTAQRFQAILAVVAVPVLAAALDAPAVRRWAASRRPLVGIGLGALTLAYAVLGTLAVGHLGRPLQPVAPVQALPAGCRLVNSYDIGGLVILLRPDIPVSLDSRNDLYGRADAVRLNRLVDADSGGPQRLAEMGATCVLVPERSGLARQLAGHPGWRQIVKDRKGTVFVRAPD